MQNYQADGLPGSPFENYQIEVTSSSYEDFVKSNPYEAPKFEEVTTVRNKPPNPSRPANKVQKSVKLKNQKPVSIPIKPKPYPIHYPSQQQVKRVLLGFCLRRHKLPKA